MTEQARATAPGIERAVMRSPAHRLHASMGAVFEDHGSWQVPARYGSAEAETEAMRSTLGYADVSAQGKVHLSGAVEPWIRLLTGGSLVPLKSAPAGPNGIVARVAREWAVAIVSPSSEGDVLAKLDGAGGAGAMATDMTSSMSGFLVAGPRLSDLLARTLTLDLSEVRAGTCAAAAWARIPAIVVGLDLGSPAVELYVGSEYGRYAWQTLRDMCVKLGGSPVGWAAIESAGWRR